MHESTAHRRRQVASPQREAQKQGPLHLTLRANPFSRGNAKDNYDDDDDDDDDGGNDDDDAEVDDDDVVGALVDDSNPEYYIFA